MKYTKYTKKARNTGRTAEAVGWNGCSLLLWAVKEINHEIHQKHEKGTRYWPQR